MPSIISRGGDHAGEQRDLGVPELDRDLPAELEPEAAVGSVLDLLLGQRERDAAARLLLLLAQLPDLAQQLQHLAGGAVVERGLRGVVRRARPRDRTRARSTVTSVGAPARSSVIDHNSAGRTWSGSSDAAPSDSAGGWSGIRLPAP